MSSSSNVNDGTNMASGGGQALINPHNPEFITKKPWYLSNAVNTVDDPNEPTLDHQTDQRPDKYRKILTLTSAEEILIEQREQEKQLILSGTYHIGQWVEALKRNQYPYRICQVMAIHNNKNSNNKKGIELDLQYEDMSIERRVKVWNPRTNKPTVRMTKTGNRSILSSSSSSGNGGGGGGLTLDGDGKNDTMKITYDGKRDQYHGYDRDTHNKKLMAKYNQRAELRKQQIKQLQQQQTKEEQDKEKQQQQPLTTKTTGIPGTAKTTITSVTTENNKSSTAAATTTMGTNPEVSIEKHSDSDADSDIDSDSDNEGGRGGDGVYSSDDDDDEEEFVQKDADAKVITSRLARQGGVGGAQMKMTARNLRIREDTAKYLRNLDPNSAYYDPKSRSMRDNPNPEIPIHETEYAGDNFIRHSGTDVKELAQTQLFAWDEKKVQQVHNKNNNNNTDGDNNDPNNHNIHPQANPSQAELLKKQYVTKVLDTKVQQKRAVLDKYGGAEYLDGKDGLAAVMDTNRTAATTTNTNEMTQQQQQQHLVGGTTSNNAAVDRAIRFGGTADQEQYSAIDGRLVTTTDVRKQKTIQQQLNQKRLPPPPRQPIPCKYEENIFMHGHHTVWGSYFHKGAFKWGYGDDHSLTRFSYCTGTGNGRSINDEQNLLTYGTGQTGSAELLQAKVAYEQIMKLNRSNSTTNNNNTQNNNNHTDNTHEDSNTSTTTTNPIKLREELRRQQQELLAQQQQEQQS